MKQKNLSNIKILLGIPVIVHIGHKKCDDLAHLAHNFGADMREFQHEN